MADDADEMDEREDERRRTEASAGAPPAAAERSPLLPGTKMDDRLRPSASALPSGAERKMELRRPSDVREEAPGGAVPNEASDALSFKSTAEVDDDIRRKKRRGSSSEADWLDEDDVEGCLNDDDDGGGRCMRPKPSEHEDAYANLDRDEEARGLLASSLAWLVDGEVDGDAGAPAPFLLGSASAKRLKDGDWRPSGPLSAAELASETASWRPPIGVIGLAGSGKKCQPSKADEGDGREGCDQTRGPWIEWMH